MKSVAELQAVKAKMKGKVIPCDPGDKIRVVVGLATCGIAAGATPVYETIVKEVKEQALENKITVAQTGCIGICQFEPVVEVHEAGKRKVTYVKMTAEKAKRVVEEHLKGGKPVAEFTLAGQNV